MPEGLNTSAREENNPAATPGNASVARVGGVGGATREEQTSESVLGRWFWVDGKDYNDEPNRWVGCVVHEGSNYVLVRGVDDEEVRVHNDDFFETLTEEPNPQQVIDDHVRGLQSQSAALIKKVSDLTRGLGIDARGIAHSGGTALTVAAGQREVTEYKSALEKAQKETLPALFQEIKDVNKALAKWMAASILPLEAQLDTAEETVTHIQRRIYAIELYAGVTEEVEQVANGDPAPASEKVRLFQRKLYMDEECLADYRAGGMEFKDIRKFDRWLLKPDNLRRMLPTPRCIVAMQVRRNEKERETASILSAFVNIDLARDDNATFLYIRNGGNVYRLSTEIDFGDSLFPDRESFDPQPPMMAKMFAHRVDKLVDRAEFEAMVAEDEERKRNSKRWLRENPQSTWDKSKGMREFANPYRDTARFRPSEYQPFDPSSVYYDDIAEELSERIAHYNRVALIVQGLFDRSPVFQPHTMAKVWKPEDFLNAVELVYDNSAALYDGDAPDFEEYRARLNASLGEGSVTIGQERCWMEREASKYNERGSRSYYRGFNPVKLHRPHGDPGPGFVASIAQWKPRSGGAVFRWPRRRSSARRYSSGSEILNCTIVVPANRLLNVSAYQPGDFRRFFSDPRTREQYIQWAPFLLGAEDWHAGKRRPMQEDD
ncbi:MULTISPECIES: hypothetical protein [unclassified Bradyrhizobium]